MAWSAGRPLLGLHVTRVGLTRYALIPPGSAALWWIAAVATFFQYRADPTGEHTVPDDHTFIAGPAQLFVAAVLVVFGLVTFVIAARTLHQWGRWLTTRYRPPEAPAPSPEPVSHR